MREWNEIKSKRAKDRDSEDARDFHERTADFAQKKEMKDAMRRDQLIAEADAKLEEDRRMNRPTRHHDTCEDSEAATRRLYEEALHRHAKQRTLERHADDRSDIE